MALHPVNDRFKVKVEKKDKYNLAGDSADSAGTETGIVVEVPDILIYLSFHSFAFEESIANEEKLKKVQEFYNQFKNKRIFWEALQDRGRKIQEGDEEFVYLQMTDILAYADDVKDDAQVINQVGSAGSFNL